MTMVAALACSTGSAFAQTTAPDPAQSGSAGPVPTPAPVPITSEDAAAVAQDGNPSTAEGDIVVTGSRLKNGFQTPTPVTQLGNEAIAQRAPTAIVDVVNQLPSFKPQNFSQTARQSIGTNGTAFLNLRGLGNSRTLVLVDGKRVPGNGLLGGAVDTNSIPTLLVSRIDVVTGGASAAYGSDAVAGVVNFVLKDKMEGLEAVAQKGVNDHGDGDTTLLGFAWGSRLGDNLHLSVGGEYVRDDGIGSALTRDWGRREVGILALGSGRAAGTPAQVFADNVRFTNIAPGGLIVSGPLRGLAFNPDGSTRRFDFGTITGGNQMSGSTDNQGVSLFGYSQLRPPVTRGSGLANLTWDVDGTTKVTLAGNYNFNRTHAITGVTYPRSDIVILANNPFIPANVLAQMRANGLDRIVIGRSNDDIGTPRGNSTTDQYRVTLGAEGKIGAWDWDAYVQYGKVAFNYNADNEVLVPNYNAALYAVRAPDGSIVCGPAATNPNLTAAQAALVTSGCVPLNPFGAGAASAAALGYVAEDERGRSRNDQFVTGVNLRGSLFTLPAGDVAIAVGGEARRETIRYAASPLVGRFNVGNVQGFDGRIGVVEGYAETTVPILRDVPFIRALDVNGAVRYADYSTIGGSTTWKVGGTWDVVQWLRLRATRSHDLRAPNFTELFQTFSQPTTVRNPRTGSSGFVTQNLTAGNLGAEQADTFTAGVILTPSRRIRLSVDYYNITIDGAITRPTVQQVVDGCYLQNSTQFCSLLTADNSALGLAQVTTPQLNFAQLRARGIDTEASVQFPVNVLNEGGRVAVSGLVSYLDRLDQVAGGVLLDNLGVTLPKWRFNARIDYSDSGPFSGYFQVIGAGKTRYSSTLVGPEDDGYNPAASNSISKNSFPAIAYLNTGLNVDIANGRYRLYATIDNLLDQDPPYGGLFNNAGVYDYYGRSYKVGVRLKL